MNQEDITFSSAITEYISMALQIWPALQIALSNLQQACAPPSESPIPPRNYKDMTSQQFIKIMVSDMHKYILEHDVKQIHIAQYLDDILAILNTEQENQQNINCMANQLVLLINQLPEGETTRLINFRQFYNSIKGHHIHHQMQDNQEQQNSEGEGSEDYCDQEDQEQWIGEQENIIQPNLQKTNQKQDEEPPLLTQNKNTQLEDDGWVVVTKKKKK